MTLRRIPLEVLVQEAQKEERSEIDPTTFLTSSTYPQRS